MKFKQFLDDDKLLELYNVDKQLKETKNWHFFRKWIYLKDKQTPLQQMIEKETKQENETNRTS